MGFPNGEEGQLASSNCQEESPSGQTGSQKSRLLYKNGKRGPKMVKILNIQKVSLGTVSREKTAVLLDFVQTRPSILCVTQLRAFMPVYIETSQELRMLSRSLSDCKSLLLNVMIQVSQFIRNGQLCH